MFPPQKHLHGADGDKRHSFLPLALRGHDENPPQSGVAHRTTERGDCAAGR